MSITIDNVLNSLSSDSQTLTINTTGSIIVPKGSTAQRPGSVQTGMTRYNTDIDNLEYYRTSGWQAIPTSAPDSSDAIAFAIVFG